MQNNEASLAGIHWKDFNENRYVRVILDRPISKSGPIYYFHLLMTRFINGHLNALVGYKYERGVQNDDPQNGIWQRYGRESRTRHNILPKQVGYPIPSLISEIESISK